MRRGKCSRSVWSETELILKKRKKKRRKKLWRKVAPTVNSCEVRQRTCEGLKKNWTWRSSGVVVDETIARDWVWMWLQLSRGHTEVRSRPLATSCFCQRQTSKPGNRWTWVSSSSLAVSSSFVRFGVLLLVLCLFGCGCVCWPEVFEELIVCFARKHSILAPALSFSIFGKPSAAK